MKGGALALGIVAALVGAGLWAGIAAGTGYEIGWIAWGIGIGVGVGVRLGGGEGATAGLCAAALALVAILGGKILTVNLVLPGQLDDIFTEEQYDEIMTDAEDYAALEYDEDVPQFMVDHGYTEATKAKNVSAEELASFEANQAKNLEQWSEAAPSFSEWKEGLAEEALAGYSFMDRIKDSLGMMDIIFILLGLSSAFKAAESGDGDA